MKLPQHIAIMMDGNRRWAKRRGLPSMMGHQAGRRALKKIVQACVAKKIEILTVYAFSTENWKRPKLEVEGLMRLFNRVLETEVKQLHENNVKFKVIGEIAKLSPLLQKKINQAEFLTKNNTGLILNVAINYGSRLEITQAARRLAEKVQAGVLLPSEITENLLQDHFWLSDTREPDLLIRTSGEFRVSNFLLWQCAYTEFYFTETCFPDFSPLELEKAILAYHNRHRRYGAGTVKTLVLEEGHCA